jgi:hypothetical protein
MCVYYSRVQTFGRPGPARGWYLSPVVHMVILDKTKRDMAIQLLDAGPLDGGFSFSFFSVTIYGSTLRWLTPGSLLGRGMLLPLCFWFRFRFRVLHAPRPLLQPARHHVVNVEGKGAT